MVAHVQLCLPLYTLVVKQPLLGFHILALMNICEGSL